VRPVYGWSAFDWKAISSCVLNATKSGTVYTSDVNKDKDLTYNYIQGLTRTYRITFADNWAYNGKNSATSITQLL